MLNDDNKKEKMDNAEVDEKEKEKKQKEKNKKNRTFIINKKITSESIQDIILGILEINKIDDEHVDDEDYEREPIKLIVDSYGGVVYDGFSLVSVIDTSETPVHTYLYGKAMSMGLLIFSSGHKRFAHMLGRFLYHQISGGMMGTLEEMYESMERYKELQELYDGYLLSVSDIPKEILEKTVKSKKDWEFSAQDGKSLGLVDEILVSKRGR